MRCFRHSLLSASPTLSWARFLPLLSTQMSSAMFLGISSPPPIVTAASSCHHRISPPSVHNYSGCIVDVTDPLCAAHFPLVSHSTLDFPDSTSVQRFHRFQVLSSSLTTIYPQVSLILASSSFTPVNRVFPTFIDTEFH